MRRVLIVTPHFPPTNAPDHQRVRMSLPYFRENGWDPVVLAVDAGSVAGPQDPLLAATVPADVPVHRVGALPAAVTRLAGLGNVAYRAWFQLKATGDRLLRDGKFDLVYFSTTQFIATALGRRWQQQFGVPFVVDIQDPWRTDYYERPGAPTPPGGWKYRFARWQAARLEERSWRGAAGFVSVSEDYLAQLRARYTWFGSKPAAVHSLRRARGGFRTRPRPPRMGTRLCPRARGRASRERRRRRADHAHRARISFSPASATSRAAAPDEAARLRLHFIGTSYAGNRAEPSVMPVARDCGVAELVREETERVGYFTAISTLLAADAVIIPGSDDTAYNPSKIAASFLAGKPTLALTPAGSRDGPDGERTWLRHRGALARTRRRHRRDRLSARHLLHPATAPGAAVPNRALFSATHTARARTRQQCELFARALGSVP